MSTIRKKHTVHEKVKVALEAIKGEKSTNDDQEELIDELYRQIGQLKVENEFLKKNIKLST